MSDKMLVTPDGKVLANSNGTKAYQVNANASSVQIVQDVNGSSVSAVPSQKAVKDAVNILTMFPDINNYESNLFAVQSGFQVKKNLPYDGWVKISTSMKGARYCFISSRHQTNPYINYFTIASISAKSSGTSQADEYSFEAYVPVFKGQDVAIFIMDQPSVQVLTLESKYYRLKEV